MKNVSQRVRINSKPPSKATWDGWIAPPKDETSSWTFDFIREDSPKTAYRYDVSPLKDADVVIGLLDYQRRCTLVRPIVTNISVGSMGEKYIHNRTAASGIFTALLEDVAISNSKRNTFTSIECNSDSFATWSDSKVVFSGYVGESSIPFVKVENEIRHEFCLPNMGAFKTLRYAKLDEKNLRRSVKSEAIYAVTFNTPRNLTDIIEFCFQFEQLFGFLIGFRGQLPEFKVATNEKGTVQAKKMGKNGTLKLGTGRQQSGDYPDYLRCLHIEGLGNSSIETVLEKFFANPKNFGNQIGAIEFAMHFSKNVNDRFFAVMPVLEDYLRQKYPTVDESNYMEHEKNFWMAVDQISDNNITDFAKKHLKVVKSKAPSLRMLIDRSTSYLKKKGFNFPDSLGKKVNERRGSAFHSPPNLVKEQDVIEFYIEVNSLTAVLLLHTLEDLGIDISYLTSRPMPPPILRDFIAR